MAASDLRRSQIIDLMKQVDDLIVPESQHEDVQPDEEQVRRAIQMTHEVLGLLSGEGLLTQFAADHFDVLAGCYTALGDNREARRYAELVLGDRYAGQERREAMEKIATA